jgi:hypothetical protein
MDWTNALMLEPTDEYNKRPFCGIFEILINKEHLSMEEKYRTIRKRFHRNVCFIFFGEKIRRGNI